MSWLPVIMIVAPYSENYVIIIIKCL